MKRFKWLAAAAAAGLLFTSVPAQTTIVHADAVELKQVDQETKAALDKALSNVSGGRQGQITDVVRTDISSTDKRLDVSGTLLGDIKGRFDQTYDTLKMRVSHTLIIYNAKDRSRVLSPELDARIAAFLKSFDPHGKFQPSALWRVHSPYQLNEPRNYWVFFGNDQNLYVDLDKNNQLTASMAYSLKSMPPAMINQYARVLKTLGWGGSPVQYAAKVQEGSSRLVWELYDWSNSQRVQYGVKTGKVWLAENDLLKDWNDDYDFAKSFAKPKYSAVQAIKAAKPAVSSLFGVNLTGYSVKVKANEYTFTKKGKPTVTGKINKQGKFYSLAAAPVSGMVQ